MSKRMYEPAPPDPRYIHIAPFRPMRLTRVFVANIRAMFDGSGISNHSEGASTLQIVLDHCHQNDTDTPVSGWFVVERLSGEPAAGMVVESSAHARVQELLARRQSFEATYVPGLGTAVAERPNISAEDFLRPAAVAEEPTAPGM